MGDNIITFPVVQSRINDFVKKYNEYISNPECYEDDEEYIDLEELENRVEELEIKNKILYDAVLNYQERLDNCMDVMKQVLEHYGK